MSETQTTATGTQARPRTKKRTATGAFLVGDITFTDLRSVRTPRFIPVCLGVITRHDGITRLSIEHKIDDQTVDRRNVELPPDVAEKLIEAITG